ncbi:MAG TPA: cation-transporting P-type ATPase [Thermodesulfovibrionales bacterium]|nr:cation-transporting P-type ATPase [Thermodesulfovibrionales bacterium]
MKPTTKSQPEQPVSGLTEEEAEKRFIESGPNLVFAPPGINFFNIAAHEVTEPMILLLLVVGFFYSIWGKPGDALTIFLIISLLIFAEVINEFRAKKAIAALERLAAPKSRVIRDGKIMEIDSARVVTGDLLVLIPGAKIAADAEIRWAEDLRIDESALTGESFPQEKQSGADIYAGTVVITGEGRAEVCAVGKNTRLGSISRSLAAIRPPKTALQSAMKSLAGRLVYISLFFSVVIPLVGLSQGGDLRTMILTGLSLSFATIPEELPIIITMVLGLGAFKLSKSNLLIKHIRAAETLGNATVIVSDKTGTITMNRMQIVSAYPDRKEEVFEKALCCISTYSFSPMEQEVRRKVAELNISAKCGEVIRQRNFGGDRKTKSVLRNEGASYGLFTVGAPEEVFDCCSGVTEDITLELTNQTAKGRRVIGVAYRKLTSSERDQEFSLLENGMDFVGLISFEDPPKEGVRETILETAGAGIRTIMVTGDHLATARYIAGQVGIAAPGDRAMNGKELDGISDEELGEIVGSVRVFARATPEHKLRIVAALQSRGEVVAVTGDGINDALALKLADIGIAMGTKGTDVAREAAEVVVADDNFTTITRGIYEGRKFFDNLQKGIKYYLSVKLALIMIFLLPVVLGIPMPLTPVQIILLELLMDLAASVGFIAEPEEKDIHSRPPRSRRERIFNAGVVKDILIKGTVMFAAVTVVYLYFYYESRDVPNARTCAFSAWIIAHVMLAYVSRSESISIFSRDIFSNEVIDVWAISAFGLLFLGMYLPGLRERLNLVSVGLGQLAIIALAVSCIIGLLELRKRFGRNLSGTGGVK